MASLPPPPTPPGAVPGDDSAARRRALLGVGVRADLVDSADTARDLVLRTTSSGVDLDLVDGVDALYSALDSLANGAPLPLTIVRGNEERELEVSFE